MLRYLVPLLIATLLGLAVWTMLRRLDRKDSQAARHRRHPAADWRLSRLSLLQWLSGLLPAVAVVLILQGESALGMAIAGAWLPLAAGIAALAMGVRAEARGASGVASAGAGALLVAGGAGAVQLAVGAPVALAALLGVGTGAAALVLFGPGRWRGDGRRGALSIARIQRFAAGRKRIEELRYTADAIPDGSLRDRLAKLADRAEHVLDLAETHAADSGRSRRFLGVWLVGAVDVTRAFVSAEAAGDAERAARYAGLLDDLERALERLEASMHEVDLTRFDVEIETLSERLAGEGLV